MHLKDIHNMAKYTAHLLIIYYQTSLWNLFLLDKNSKYNKNFESTVKIFTKFYGICNYAFLVILILWDFFLYCV